MPLRITTPAGPCPAKLTGTDEKSVYDWADRVMDAGERQGVQYAPAALRYFVRFFYEINSPEYQTVCTLVDPDYRPKGSIRPSSKPLPLLPIEDTVDLDESDDMPPPPRRQRVVIPNHAKLVSELGTIARNMSKGSDEEMEM